MIDLKLPLKVREDRRSYNTDYYDKIPLTEIVGYDIVDADGADVVGCEGILPEGEKAAAAIVHACNVHDELVAALRRARTDVMAAATFSELCHDSPLSFLDHMKEGLPSMKATLSVIESALAKAKDSRS